MALLKHCKRTWAQNFLKCLIVGLGIGFSVKTGQAATLHALLLFDTFERPDRIETYNFLYYELENMAKMAGLSYQPHSFIAADFDYARIVDFLEQFQCGAQDTVLLAFDGHGASAAASNWPRLWFRLTDQEMTFDYIAGKLRVKKPRLLIVLSGACNSGQARVVTPPLRQANSTGNLSFAPSECFRGLLAQMRGEVFGTASQPGEVSWSTDRNVYLTAFVKGLGDVCEQVGSANWDEVMQAAYNRSVWETQTLRSGNERGPQHPIDYVNVTSETLSLDEQFNQLMLLQKSVDDLDVALRQLSQEYKCITWWIQNNFSTPINIELYAQNRFMAWPGGGKVYVLPNDGQPYTIKTCAAAGEQICYGAWAENQPLKAWGVGPDQTILGNQNACYSCADVQTELIQFLP